MLLSECYLYTLLDSLASSYNILDLFAEMKRDLCAGIDEHVASSAAQMGWQAVPALVYKCLWGNKNDLSFNHKSNPLGNRSVQPHPQSETGFSIGEAGLVIDDCTKLVASLRASSGALLWIADNTGPELVNDLVLITHLLKLNKSLRIHLELKMNPWFVSDATAIDFKGVCSILKESLHIHARSLGNDIEFFVDTARILVGASGAWTTCLDFWTLKSHCYQQEIEKLFSIKDLQMVILKGDLNYRKITRDLMFTSEIGGFHGAIKGFLELGNGNGFSVCCIRVCKSECVAGLDENQRSFLDERDPKWMSNGEWGMIQLYEPELPDLAD